MVCLLQAHYALYCKLIIANNDIRVQRKWPSSDSCDALSHIVVLTRIVMFCFPGEVGCLF